MKSEVGWGHQWNSFWFRECPPHALAIVRIAFGGFLLSMWLLRWRAVPMLFSREGIVLPLFSSPLLTPPSAVGAWMLYACFLVLLACLTVGFYTRLSAGLCVFFFAYFWLLSLYQFNTSFDRLFFVILLALTPSGAGKTLSVDAWRKKGSFLAWEPISILPQRLLAAQITATYLGVGWQKLALSSWQGGEVLAWGFMGKWATPLAFWILRRNVPIAVYDFGVFLVKSFEVIMPFALWNKRLRRWAFAAGALFHIAIALLLSIPWFLVLIPLYIVFLDPEDVRAWIEARR
ncbi:HTTM domain-containing protein [Candidatus Peregrinibacteria bacterium]|nr:HTTM domain-containing protein [Candidatus Peregrinibacteria bacterium]MBI3816308.1 HTTM domain-containing protein [Candidatus Peregrinibacteria bacterium]